MIDTGPREKGKDHSNTHTAGPMTRSKGKDILTAGVNRSTFRDEQKEAGGSDIGKLEARDLDALARIYEMVLGWDPQT